MPATRQKLEHDAEQFLYLSQRRRDRLRFELLARSYGTVAKQIPDEVAALSGAQIGLLGEGYNAPIRLHAAPEVAGHAVNERTDLAALTAETTLATDLAPLAKAGAANSATSCLVDVEAVLTATAPAS